MDVDYNKMYQEHLNEKTGAQCGGCGEDLTFGNEKASGFCAKCVEQGLDH